MKRTIRLLYAALLGLVVTSCHSDEEWTSTGSGFLISLSDEPAVNVTRSTPAELGKPSAEKFQLKITKNATNQVIYEAAYTSAAIPASTGTYSLTASHGENPVLAWDAPYYEGSAEAEVEADKMTSVNIPCHVANALLSVVYSNPERFASQYSSYGTRVKVENYSLDIESGHTHRSAYFRAGSKVELTFHGVLKDNGQEVTLRIEDKNLPDTYGERTHTKLTLTAATPASGTILTVDKVEIKEVTVSETIPLEWLPKPKVTGFADGTKSMTYTETADAPANAVICYTASMPVQDVEFTLDFKDETYKKYNRTYTLSALTAEERETLEGIGIQLPVLDGTSTTGALDLSSLSAEFQTNAGEEVENSLKMRVKANNRWSSEEGESYQIKVVKPEFSVSVQEGNCWTKEFTIDEVNVTSGNVEKIKENLVYQYSADGGTTWIDCENTIKFGDTPTNKNYKVKACYRNCISSNNIADAVLEVPTQIPNSDMENWHIETKKKSGTWPFKDKTYYTFHPYADGESSSSWWDTNNNLAQGGTYALGIWYEGCFASCVSYTEDAQEGNKAALMYLSGCGNSYANTSGTYVGGAMVGSLFIGSYNSGIIQGHDFASRPTSLSFWYKYKPYNSDAFKVVVSLKNGDEEIAAGTYEPAAYSTEDNSYQQAKVDLTYKTTSKKATTICVQFLASNKTSLSKSDFALGTTINYPIIGDWTVHMGSILKIDNLSLNYTR